jgi:hypothetical protein
MGGGYYNNILVINSSTMESSKLVSEPQACPPKKNKIDKHIKLIKEAIELIEKVVTLDSQ